ncbi:MAG TPA: class I SAM-dependent methyltransferase [Bryobacteraceae bacterium]|jgi:SAM-dependent methyltransferase
MRLRLFAAATCLWSALAFGQKPEYDFYADYRTFMSSLWVKNPAITSGEIHEAYAAKLKGEGIPAAEIARRLRLLATEGPQLEADRWNRYYGDAKNNQEYNQSPNAFLMAFVAEKRPGVALDYAMGTGRNALYLAKLGWDVYGFDQSDVAVAMAQKRALELGLKLHTAAVPDSQYDFGKERFDLIVFSWAMPLIDAKKVVDSLKPGGYVVMECAVDYVGRNGMLKKFDDLRIERYEIVRAVADWYGRREIEVLHLVARKQ